MLSSTSKMFDDYARVKFSQLYKFFSAKYKRTDIVFDMYLPSILKSETKSKRGKRVRRRVAGKN